MNQPQIELKKEGLDNINISTPVRLSNLNSGSIKMKPELSEPEVNLEKSNQQGNIAQQTYYISSFRQNFLVLVSDHLQVIEFPVGVLKGNIKIGDPVKLKLQFDFKRAQLDRKKFNSLQQNILKEYSS